MRPLLSNLLPHRQHRMPGGVPEQAALVDCDSFKRLRYLRFDLPALIFQAVLSGHYTKTQPPVTLHLLKQQTQQADLFQRFEPDMTLLKSATPAADSFQQHRQYNCYCE